MGKHDKWILLALVSGAYFLQQGMRQIYNVALPQIKADFSAVGVGDVQLGVVATVFTLVYGFSVPFAGLAADLLRRKWVLIAGVFLFSLGVVGAGFSSGVVLMVAGYGVLNGVGQSSIAPSATSLIGEYHDETRSTALSIFQMANYAGVVLCSVLGGWLAGLGAGMWRWAFKGLGLAGIVWAVVLVFAVREKAAPPGAGRAPGPGDRPSLKGALSAMFTNPTALLFTAAFGCCVAGDVGFRTWTPTLLQEIGVTPSVAGFHSVFWFYLGAFAGITAAGRLSDRLAARSPVGRIALASAGLLLSAPFLFWASRSGTMGVICLALGLFGVARGVYDANFIVTIHEAVDPRYRAAATGFFCSAAFVAGAFSPMALGWCKTSYGLGTSMSAMSGCYVLAGLVMLASLAPRGRAGGRRGRAP